MYIAMAPKRLHSFLLDPDLTDGLKLLKERDGIAESGQVRRALRGWLAERGAMSGPLSAGLDWRGFFASRNADPSVRTWFSAESPTGLKDASLPALIVLFRKELIEAFPDGLPWDMDVLRSHIEEHRAEWMAKRQGDAGADVSEDRCAARKSRRNPEPEEPKVRPSRRRGLILKPT
jgi:hypothetical protein